MTSTFEYINISPVCNLMHVLISLTAPANMYGRIPQECSVHSSDKWVDNLSVGMPTLNKLITAHRDNGVLSKENLSHAKENDGNSRETHV